MTREPRTPPRDVSPRAIVHATAALARLELPPQREEALAGEFARILEAFAVLSELETADEDVPMARVSSAENVVRADERRPSLAPDDVLANAPERSDDFYSVPKAVGGGE